MFLSIIIPVFNEENFIKDVVKNVLKSIKKYKSEVIIVDDGSTDRTSQIIKNIAIKNIKIKIITNNINLGKTASLKKGFQKSKGEIVIVQDADMEYNPKDYKILIKPFLEKNADVVYGSRFTSHRSYHQIANLLATKFSNFSTGLDLTDIETGFKVFKGNLIRILAPKLESCNFNFEPEITAKISKIKKLKIWF